MPALMLKRDAALLLLIIEAAAIVGVVYFLVILDFMSLAWSLSLAIAIPAWVLAVKAPTVCGVTTQKGGKCSRNVNGVIFGCGTSNHTWAKFFSRFGWRRQPDPNSIPSKAGASTRVRRPGSSASNDGVEVMTVKIAEDTKSKVAFWLALTATTCALVSATVDATNFVKAQKQPAKASAVSIDIASTVDLLMEDRSAALPQPTLPQ
ncbi:hypothetical protein [Micromonospora sp. NPDC048063]|uniref:hypothetical protein n=1 Tax=Micromonospora sp. NPDC048063 TaxID=3364256 RepID=UPI0037234183